MPSIILKQLADPIRYTSSDINFINAASGSPSAGRSASADTSLTAGSFYLRIVQTPSTFYVQQSLLSFDLSAVPPGATVSSWSLAFSNGSAIQVDFNLEVRRVTTPDANGWYFTGANQLAGLPLVGSASAISTQSTKTMTLDTSAFVFQQTPLKLLFTSSRQRTFLAPSTANDPTGTYEVFNPSANNLNGADSRVALTINYTVPSMTQACATTNDVGFRQYDLVNSLSDGLGGLSKTLAAHNSATCGFGTGTVTFLAGPSGCSLVFLDGPDTAIHAFTNSSLIVNNLAVGVYHFKVFKAGYLDFYGAVLVDPSTLVNGSLNKMIALVPAPTQATLEVTGYPSGADLWVNGAYVGKTGSVGLVPVSTASTAYALKKPGFTDASGTTPTPSLIQDYRLNVNLSEVK